MTRCDEDGGEQRMQSNVKENALLKERSSVGRQQRVEPCRVAAVIELAGNEH